MAFLIRQTLIYAVPLMIVAICLLITGSNRSQKRRRNRRYPYK